MCPCNRTNSHGYGQSFQVERTRKTHLPPTLQSVLEGQGLKIINVRKISKSLSAVPPQHASQETVKVAFLHEISSSYNKPEWRFTSFQFLPRQNIGVFVVRSNKYLKRCSLAASPVEIKTRTMDLEIERGEWSSK